MQELHSLITVVHLIQKVITQSQWARNDQRHVTTVYLLPLSRVHESSHVLATYFVSILTIIPGTGSLQRGLRPLRLSSCV